MINKKLKEISEVTISKDLFSFDEKMDFGLYSGLMGIAIFNFEYYRYSQDKLFYEVACNQIDYVLQHIDKVRGATFCNGLAGIGWGLLYLNENKLIDIKDDGFFEALDKYLFNYCAKYIKHENWDFMHGALGIVFYYLKRLSNSYVDRIVNYVNHVVSEVIKLGDEINKYQIAFSTTSIFGRQDTYAPNISLCHGMASILIMFSKVFEHNVPVKNIRDFMEKTYNYIVAQRNLDYNSIGSMFPLQCLSYNKEDRKSRLAWCYGDLGIANAIYYYGNCIKDKSIIDFSLEIMLNTTQRRTLEDTYVIDTCFCHGSSGVAHMYNSFYNKSKEVIFKEVANFWMKETLKNAKYEDGLAGYKTFSPPQHGGWKNKVNILEGIAGNGLAMIAHTSDQFIWDECFLLR